MIVIQKFATCSQDFYCIFCIYQRGWFIFCILGTFYVAASLACSGIKKRISEMPSLLEREAFLRYVFICWKYI